MLLRILDVLHWVLFPELSQQRLTQAQPLKLGHDQLHAQPLRYIVKWAAYYRRCKIWRLSQITRDDGWWFTRRPFQYVSVATESHWCTETAAGIVCWISGDQRCHALIWSPQTLGCPNAEPCGPVPVDTQIQRWPRVHRMHLCLHQNIQQFPTQWDSPQNDKAEFKAALRKYLHTHFFYCVDGFFLCVQMICNTVLWNVCGILHCKFVYLCIMTCSTSYCP